MLIVLVLYDLFEVKFFSVDFVSKGGKETPDLHLQTKFDFFLKQAKEEIKSCRTLSIVISYYRGATYS